MGFKVIRTNTPKIEDLAQSALEQIITKRYYNNISNNVKTILLLGIAFEGKKSFVVSDIVKRD
ncbi:hypothetical protein BC938DRAFT_478306 [Jimgerdemannia flammicorona]|uniref:Uncharacterized protein n=1 Tax=Jimgerdemannia flammicorona TaxID=994334 RepID=A0A433P5U2_9FUNG|nr:hypothetical protein BC938DRAFT_478306 [Jimgerdemannia flammicorona]